MSRFIAEPQPEPETVCHKHPKVHTALACGKCGKFICPKCVVPSPAGTRCRECAKSDVVFRPGAIWLGIKRSVQGIFGGRYSYFAIIVFLSLIGYVMRSCQSHQTYEEVDVPEQSGPAK